MIATLTDYVDEFCYPLVFVRAKIKLISITCDVNYCLRITLWRFFSFLLDPIIKTIHVHPVRLVEV